MPTLLVLGAKSDIALATAHRFAREGYSIVLAARNNETLISHAADLEIRYKIKATVLPYDAIDFASHAQFVESLNSQLDVVLFSVGFLGCQEESQHSYGAASLVVASNYLAAISILEPIAAVMARRGSGTIIAISSVAGDRGRKSNYIYGSAKAGLSAYLSGLRNRLFSAGVHVMTVKPGFVRTAMTAELALPKLLTAEPEQVAKDIFRGFEKKRDIVYTMWVWFFVMVVIRLIPERIFKRLSL